MTRFAAFAVGALILPLVAAGGAGAAETAVFASVDNKIQNVSIDPTSRDTVFEYGDLLVGCVWELYYLDGLPHQTFVCGRSLLWFDVGSLIDGRTIELALLRVYPYSVPLQGDTTYAVAPILGEWHPDTVTWNNQPTAASPVDTLPAPVTTALPMEFDVTSTVQEWADGSRTNYGLRLRDLGDSTFPYLTTDRSIWIESLDYGSTSDRRPQIYLEIADVGPGPTLSFWADPPVILSGGQSTLRWQSTNATTCYATQGSWGSPDMPTSGSEVVSLRVSATYGLG